MYDLRLLLIETKDPNWHFCDLPMTFLMILFMIKAVPITETSGQRFRLETKTVRGTSGGTYERAQIFGYPETGRTAKDVRIEK